MCIRLQLSGSSLYILILTDKKATLKKHLQLFGHFSITKYFQHFGFSVMLEPKLSTIFKYVETEKLLNLDVFE